MHLLSFAVRAVCTLWTPTRRWRCCNFEMRENAKKQHDATNSLGRRGFLARLQASTKLKRPKTLAKKRVDVDRTGTPSVYVETGHVPVLG